MTDWRGEHLIRTSRNFRKEGIKQCIVCRRPLCKENVLELCRVHIHTKPHCRCFQCTRGESDER
jgi:hypothetical protein